MIDDKHLHEITVIVFCDNKTTLQISFNPMYHEITKHIEIDCHFVRERLQDGMIKLEHTVSKEQLADLFTKSLGKIQHLHLLEKLQVVNIYETIIKLKGSVEEQSDNEIIDRG